MCHNVILYSYNGRVPEALFEDLVWSAQANGDGFAIFYLPTKGEGTLVRTLSLRRYLKHLLDASEVSLRTLHVHLRLASSGEVSEENVHLWAYEDMIVSHNGYVGKYLRASLNWRASLRNWEEFDPYEKSNPYKSAYEFSPYERSDSYEFFLNRKEELYDALRSLDPRSAKAIANSDRLHGVLLIQSMRDGSFIGVGIGRDIFVYRTKEYLVASNTPVGGLGNPSLYEMIAVDGRGLMIKEKSEKSFWQRSEWSWRGLTEEWPWGRWAYQYP